LRVLLFLLFTVNTVLQAKILAFPTHAKMKANALHGAKPLRVLVLLDSLEGLVIKVDMLDY